MSVTTPYKGLVAYDEEDAEFFFGRDAEREIITANLMASRLTILYGASGVGKSSLLNAGVAHHLRKLGQQNIAANNCPEFGLVVFSSWRDDPVAGLIERINETVNQLLPEVQENDSWVTTRTLADTLHHGSERVEGDLLVILDQFEEFFLYHAREHGADNFSFEFPRAVNNAELRVSFLISIREDALAKLDHFKGRLPQLFHNYLRLEHLDREAARAAITQPIQKYNQLKTLSDAPISVEPALVEAVLDQVRTGEVALGEVGRGRIAKEQSGERIETPFLQLVMERLWREEMNNRSNTLRLDTLDRLGKAERIVRTHLDAKMDELPLEEQEMASRIFNYLVTSSGNKIAHTVADLADYTGLSQKPITSVLTELSSPDIRILRTVDPPTNQPSALRYEIFHDVLAKAVLDWRARHAEKQRDVQAKQLADAAAKKQEEAKRELEYAQSVSFSINLAASVESQAIADPELSALLAAEAVRTAPTEQALDALRHSTLLLYLSLARQTANTEDLDSRGWIIAGIDDSVSHIWDSAIANVIAELRGHTGPIRKMVFSADGRLILSAGADRTARLWEVGSSRLLFVVEHSGPVRDAAFSPNGKLIATASADGTARVWETLNGQSLAVLRGHASDVDAVAFSPDGQLIATAGLDKTARVWDLKKAHCRVELKGHTGPVRKVGFSREGARIITASVDETARVWDVGTGECLAILRGHTEPVLDAVFSPDPSWVVTTSRDGTLRVWDADAATSVFIANDPFRPRVSEGVIFSPNDRWMVVLSAEGTALLRETRTGIILAQLDRHSHGAISPVFSPDGKLAAVVGTDLMTCGCKMIFNAGQLIMLLSQITDRALTAEERRIYIG